MLSTGPSWRTFTYAVLGFSVAMFVLAFFFVEETAYDRSAHMETTILASGSDGGSGDQEKLEGASKSVERTPSTPSIPARKSFVATLRLWEGIDHEVPFFAMMWRSFTYFLVPQVLWVVTTFGINIGLGALTFNFVFPIKITAPPYNWPVVSQNYFIDCTVDKMLTMVLVELRAWLHWTVRRISVCASFYLHLRQTRRTPHGSKRWDPRS